jgi:hypothetical protein
MAYPIQPTPVADYLDVYIVGSPNVSLEAYVTSITGNVGSARDNYYCAIDTGLCTITLRDHKTLLDANELVPGSVVKVESGSTLIFYGWVRDITTTYVFDTQLARLVPETQFTVGDIVTKLGNITIAEKALITGAGLTQTLSQLNTKLSAATGNTVSGWTGSSTAVNQFIQGGTATELIEIAARGAGHYLYGGKDTLRAKAITAPSSYPYLITDGTHTSTGGATVLSPIDIDHGYSSDAVVSSITINNVGFNRPARSADDVEIQDLTIPYTKTQSLNVNQAFDVTTAIPAPINNWNYLSNSWARPETPNIGSTQFEATVTYERYRNLGKNSIKLTPVASPMTESVIFFDHTEMPDVIVNQPTGNYAAMWYFRFYAKLYGPIFTPQPIRPFIRWVNSNGATITTDYGSWTTISDYTNWQELTVHGGYPTNCYSMDVGFEINTDDPPILYITDASLTQGGYDTFDGDSADTSSYLYTWVGSQFNSPTSQNSNTLDTLASTILARNTPRELTKTVTLNAFESFSDMLALINMTDTQPSNGGVKVCVNEVTKNYRPVGYSFSIEPEHMEITFNLVDV